MTNDTNNTILLNAGDVSRPLISLENSKTLYDVRNILLKYNISRVGISSDGTIIGIITEKDISKFLYGHSYDKRRLSEIPIKDLLKSHNELITVDKTSTLPSCAKSMLNNNISSLLLVNDKGRIDEIMTKTDLVEVFAYHYSGYFIVNECMTKKVITAELDESINSLLIIMNSYNISRIVIVKNDHPVGIVTLKDFLPSSLFYSDIFENYEQNNIISTKDSIYRSIPIGVRSFLIAQDVMTAKPLLIDKDEDVTESAKVMINHRISGLPVIDSNMKLVGIITKTDVLKTVLKI